MAKGTTGLVWSPELQQLKDELQKMPEQLAGEADHRAEEAAQGAAVAIRTVYAQHWVTGNLTKGVTASRVHRGKLTPAWAVYARAPHTWIFEHGTTRRGYITKAGKTPGTGGKPHPTGAMWGKQSNPGPTFYPTVNKFRRALEQQLIDLVRRAGAKDVSRS